jgi:hypothetical protein
MCGEHMVKIFALFLKHISLHASYTTQSSIVTMMNVNQSRKMILKCTTKRTLFIERERVGAVGRLEKLLPVVYHFIMLNLENERQSSRAISKLKLKLSLERSQICPCKILIGRSYVVLRCLRDPYRNEATLDVYRALKCIDVYKISLHRRSIVQKEET